LKEEVIRVAKMKGVYCQKRNGVEYWYARIGGGKEYIGKGEQGKTDALEARHKYEFEKLQAKTQGIGLETRTTEFSRFLDMMNWYMELPSTQKKPRTYQRWVHCSIHLARYFGKRPLTQIEAVDLETYRDKRKAAGASDSTVDLEVGLMSMIYHKAKKNKMIPTEAGPGEFKRADISKPRRPITDEEYAKLLAVADIDPEYRDVVICGYETSMRAGEIARLKVMNVRFGEVISEVPEKVIADYLDVEDIKSRNEPKARKNVPISDELAKVLRRRIKGLKPTDLVFTDGRKPWDSHNGRMSKRFERLCNLAEVPYSIFKEYKDSQGRPISGIDFHCLRVTRITKWAELYNDSIVRLASGHKDPEVYRKRYCKLGAVSVMILVGKSPTEKKRIKPVENDYTTKAKSA